MSTTISGSNGIVFPDSTSMQTGQQAVKAWVNFNGEGTVSIRAGYNVSSISDFGTGDYGVNFTTAMVDANYAAGSLCGYDNASNSLRYATAYSWSQTALRINIFYTSGGDTKFDAGYVTVSIFR